MHCIRLMTDHSIKRTVSTSVQMGKGNRSSGCSFLIPALVLQHRGGIFVFLQDFLGNDSADF